MRLGGTISATLHAGVVLWIVFGLPELIRSPSDIDPPMLLDVVPVEEIAQAPPPQPPEPVHAKEPDPPPEPVKKIGEKAKEEPEPIAPLPEPDKDQAQPPDPIPPPPEVADLDQEQAELPKDPSQSAQQQDEPEPSASLITTEPKPEPPKAPPPPKPVEIKKPDPPKPLANKPADAARPPAPPSTVKTPLSGDYDTPEQKELTEDKWIKKDLSVLEGCWLLGKETPSTLMSDGKVVHGVTRTGRLCFDRTGRGTRESTQDFPGDPSLSCNASIQAKFAPNGHMVTTQAPAPCDPRARGVVWNGPPNSLDCVRKSDVLAVCIDAQGIQHEFRRPPATGEPIAIGRLQFVPADPPGTKKPDALADTRTAPPPALATIPLPPGSRPPAAADGGETGLTPQKWAQKDLTILEGCWALGRETEVTFLDAGKLVRGIARAGRLCFDKAGRGTRQSVQQFPGEPPIICNAPVRAAFDDAGKLKTTQDKVACEPATLGIVWNGAENSLECARQSNVLAICRDGQGNSNEFRRAAP